MGVYIVLWCYVLRKTERKVRLFKCLKFVPNINLGPKIKTPIVLVTFIWHGYIRSLNWLAENHSYVHIALCIRHSHKYLTVWAHLYFQSLKHQRSNLHFSRNMQVTSLAWHSVHLRSQHFLWTRPIHRHRSIHPISHLTAQNFSQCLISLLTKMQFR